MRSICVSLLAGLALACSSSFPAETLADASTDTGDESSGSAGETGNACAAPIELPEDPALPLAWTLVGELDIDDQGVSSTIDLPLAADHRYLAIRTVPLDGEADDNERLCHALLELESANLGALIPGAAEPLLDEHQRSHPGPGAGVFVLSSAAAPVLGPDTLGLRLQLRDCALGVAATRLRFPDMARRVGVEIASSPTPADTSAARLAVRLLNAADSGWGSLADDEALALTWATAVERFAAIGVELELEAEGTIDAVGTLHYKGDMVSLRALHDQALACLRSDPEDERFVPVVLVPCLYLDDEIQMTSSHNFGQTPHIPGLFDETTGPSIVVLASGSCSGPPGPSRSPESHGLILAHELGHYLGLHHVDQTLGAHLAGDPTQALMRSDLVDGVELDAAWFSAAQAEVLRRHPDVVFE